MIHFSRRALMAGLAATPVSASAQPAWRPSRPIRLIAPYTPGGGADTLARLLAGPMGDTLGQPIVVENRPGAGGSIGANEVARAEPDGHTLMCDASAHVVNPAMLRDLPFDYRTAFSYISQVSVIPMIVLVPASSRANTLADLIHMLKREPGLPYGSAGNATAPHMATVLMLARAGVQATHVPYRGGSAALPDLLSGALTFTLGTVPYSVELIRNRRVKALAVTSKERVSSVPDVPTIAESGYPDYELNEWNGLYGPAGLPTPAIQAIYQAAKTALADSRVQDRLSALGAFGLGSEPAAFAQFVTGQRDLMAQLVRENRITAE
ncbi:Bug family tripartite tricarboxylate transporter substrate binding protein [Rhodovarius lipocyclicus]|uniref:Bug family tripartite tricarboxylate transporter substrate binding protein n=1 Tax=Rhodovarius lipocyclicus TaxID=268410 RepID=UPI0013595793|nr:tripartite tricarboxylate transporter substrate binding protein [Rhodovarius lipocyclicus]